MTGPTVAVRDLEVAYPTGSGLLRAVRGVDLTVGPGERAGLVGESGCGKSSIVQAVLGLLPGDALVSGSVRVGDRSVDAADRAALATWRGGTIAAVPQGAMAGLHPSYRVGRQVAEVVRIHGDTVRGDATERADELLAGVGLDERARRAFPHELSGGMRQRVALAAALAASPAVVIADEPTVGLDAVVASRFLRLLLDRQEADGFGLLIVSHDLRAVAAACDRLVVTYAGQVVEAAPTAELLARPLHPYSSGLLDAAPSLDGRGWAAIPGRAPDLTRDLVGCAFADRCPRRHDACDAAPPRHGGGDRTVRCHLHGERSAGADDAAFEHVAFPTVRPADAPAPPPHDGHDVVVRIRALSKTYRARRWFRTHDTVALDDVDLDLKRHEIVGLVGPSGSGKSTLVRSLFRLVDPDGGSVVVDGQELVGARRSVLRDARHRLALVHQDPYASLHPAMRVRGIVEEPLVIIGADRAGRLDRVRRALELAGLDPGDDLLMRHPDQLSGGQRQRVALARAMVVDPVVLALDEPMSMLDASVRAGIAGALLDARRQLGAAIVLITHDLAEAAGICDRIVVLDRGRVVEDRPTVDLIADAHHPATRRLLTLAADPLGGDPTRDGRASAGEQDGGADRAQAVIGGGRG